ncbi:hypothetical protein F2P81_025944 [Scophthalmus maximus]|uniref:Uncharacterized protein n=1 Tax=Scophthalmus maximus TaxID=52904 RepID=A0A6A4RIU2_SCOMX|nr:hypothetical protein F2P81_025944 [Scophthalmus maximus]
MFSRGTPVQSTCGGLMFECGEWNKYKGFWDEGMDWNKTKGKHHQMDGAKSQTCNAATVGFISKSIQFSLTGAVKSHTDACGNGAWAVAWDCKCRTRDV